MIIHIIISICDFKSFHEITHSYSQLHRYQCRCQSTDICIDDFVCPNLPSSSSFTSSLMDLYKHRRRGEERKGEKRRDKRTCIQSHTRTHTDICTHGHITVHTLLYSLFLSFQNPLSDRSDYRSNILRKMIPALHAFNPDLILISTAFDGALGEHRNKCLNKYEIYFDMWRGKKYS